MALKNQAATAMSKATKPHQTNGMIVPHSMRCTLSEIYKPQGSCVQWCHQPSKRPKILVDDFLHFLAILLLFIE